MPIILNPSPAIRERLGDQATSELIDMLGTIDSTHVIELRQLNEHNVVRLEAKLDWRFTEIRLEMERRFAESRSEMERRFTDLDGRISGIRVDLADRMSAMRRWLIATWITTVLGFATLAVAILRNG